MTWKWMKIYYILTNYLFWQNLSYIINNFMSKFESIVWRGLRKIYTSTGVRMVDVDDQISSQANREPTASWIVSIWPTIGSGTKASPCIILLSVVPVISVTANLYIILKPFPNINQWRGFVITSDNAHFSYSSYTWSLIQRSMRCHKMIFLKFHTRNVQIN